MLDWLTHRVHILEANGPSYRPCAPWKRACHAWRRIATRCGASAPSLGSLERRYTPCIDELVAMTYLEGLVEAIHGYIIHRTALVST